MAAGSLELLIQTVYMGVHLQRLTEGSLVQATNVWVQRRVREICHCQIARFARSVATLCSSRFSFQVRILPLLDEIRKVGISFGCRCDNVGTGMRTIYIHASFKPIPKRLRCLIGG